MPTLDLKKLEHDLFMAPRSHAVVVDVPEELYLMIDGRGSPNEGAAFQCPRTSPAEARQEG